MQDHPAQAEIATRTLTRASLIAIAVPCLCEFAWVLQRVYKLPVSDIANGVRALLATSNLQINRPAAQAGLLVLEAGGDFADGVFAYEGRWGGGSSVVTRITSRPMAQR
jgi:predicted nucleic-acid-binding protein